MITVVNYPLSNILALFCRFPWGLLALLHLRCLILAIMFPSLTPGLIRNVLISLRGPCSQVLPVHQKSGLWGVPSSPGVCCGRLFDGVGQVFHLVPVFLSPYSVTERSVENL